MICYVFNYDQKYDLNIVMSLTWFILNKEVNKFIHNPDYSKCKQALISIPLLEYFCNKYNAIHCDVIFTCMYTYILIWHINFYIYLIDHNR